MRNLLLIVLLVCFLLGMATRAEAENVKKEAETTTTVGAITNEESKTNVENKEHFHLAKWKRDKEIDEEVRKLIGEMDIGARTTDDLISYVFASPLASMKLYNMGIIALPEMLDQIKNKKLHRHTRFDLISHLPLTEGIEDYKREVIDTLGKILLDEDEDTLVRNGICIYAFEEFKDTSATPYLIEVMENKNNPDKVRWAATHAFVFIHDEKAIKPLLENIKSDPSLDVKRISISALGAIGRETNNREMVKPLLKIVEKGEIVEKGASNYFEIKTLQYHAISSLGAIKEESVMPLLFEKVESKDRANFDVTIEALGNIGGAKAKKVLIKVLKDEKESEFIRVKAAKALLETKDKSVIPEVEKTVSGFKNEGFKKMLGNSIEQLKNSED